MRKRTERVHLDDTRALLILERTLEDAVSTKELRVLLEGLLTKGQRADFAQRVRIAFFLTAGYSYRGIRHRTGAGLATIQAVDRWLRAKNPHYRRLLPLRHRQRPSRRPRRVEYGEPLPFSSKAIFKALTGTSL